MYHHHRFRYFSKSYSFVFRFIILIGSSLILLMIYSWATDSNIYLSISDPKHLFFSKDSDHSSSSSSSSSFLRNKNHIPIIKEKVSKNQSIIFVSSSSSNFSTTKSIAESFGGGNDDDDDYRLGSELADTDPGSDRQTQTNLRSGSSSRPPAAHHRFPTHQPNLNSPQFTKGFRTDPSSSSSQSSSSSRSRPIVPHPLRPLPPPPPSSDELCDRCGCSSDKRIKRMFDQPDQLITPLSSLDQLSAVSINRSLSRFTDKNVLNLISKVWSSIRDVYCQHPMLSSEAALKLLDNSHPKSQNLHRTINLNLDSIQFGLPTLYIFTKTSEIGKTGSLRPDYFRRHVKSIRDHLTRLRENGGKYLPETEEKWGTGRRQLIWLIIEDGERLSEGIRSVLEEKNQKIPYVYYVYGPTHRYGNAQQNSAYALIHRMTSYLGQGPILSIDDDGKVLDQLFDIVWRVKRLGVWPMGNLGPYKWEGPVYDDETHEFIDWLKAKTDNRPFPVDNGAFAFSSEVFGSNHRLVGPRYWPTDYPGGESEFVSQILSRQDLVEPLCYNCRVAWHNQALKKDCIAHLPSCDEF